MNESDKEYVRRVFAELTGVLEDTSEIALKGQSCQITIEYVAQIIHSIEKAIIESDNLLKSIKKRIEH